VISETSVNCIVEKKNFHSTLLILTRKLTMRLSLLLYQEPIPPPLVSRFRSAETPRNAPHTNCWPRRNRDSAHNTRKYFPGQSRCNFDLIARYFGRTCKVRSARPYYTPLGYPALCCHADELARFASLGLLVSARSKKIVLRCSFSREIILRSL